MAKAGKTTPITGGVPKGTRVVVGSTSATRLGVSESKKKGRPSK